MIAGDANAPVRSFAHAVGFDEVVDGKRGPIQGEPGRTVRLTIVDDERLIHPVAVEIARLLAGEEKARQPARWAMQYVLVELIRNVLQHSEDPLGAESGRLRFIRIGYSGTLVAFEIPVEAPRNFDELFEEIRRRAEERTPKRLVKEWLRFELPPVSSRRSW